MLVTAVLPFSDLRPLLVPEFRRLQRPEWPTPPPDGRYMRGIGQVQPRFLKGFEGWIGEECLAIGLPGATLRLPRSAPDAGLSRIRLLRKACFFDGLMNGRFEFLFNVEAAAGAADAPLAAVRTLLRTRLVAPAAGFDDWLGRAARAAALLWAQATVRRQQDDHAKFILAARPFYVVEAEDAAPAAVRTHDAAREASTSAIGVDVTFRTDTSVKPRAEWFLITPCEGVAIGRNSLFRYRARYARTYMLRLLQDVESLALLLRADLARVQEDRIQSLMNEYTRRINRARQRLDDGTNDFIIKYCYASFERNVPGRVDGIRVALQSSNLRPNLVTKFLQFLDLIEASNITVNGILALENVVGDKYENIKVSDSQGIAIGRGAQATVTGSVNAPNKDGNLPQALAWLAQELRASQHDDAALEAGTVDAAAKKAEAGDEAGAASVLKRCGSWVLDVAKTAGSAVLESFIKLHLGLP